MLDSLYVKNLALIEEANVQFKEGLNILSGETGAGKSILMGSVNMALGGKVSKEMIRQGAEYAYAELVFTASSEAAAVLKEMDLYPEEGNQFIFSRKILPAKSICKINGESCSASVLRAAGEILLDVHGQNENQTLMKEMRQLSIVDEYIKEVSSPLLSKIGDAYRTYTAIKKELEEETLDEKQRSREISFAEYEIEEIDDANLRPGEDEQLEEDYRRMVNGKKIASALGEVYELTGNDSGASESVGRSMRALNSVLSYAKDLQGLSEQLATIEDLLGDFNRDVQDYVDSLDFEEEDFRDIENRLNTINRLKDKYGNTIEMILEYRDEKEELLAKLQDYEAYLEKKKRELAKAEKNLKEACEELKLARKAGAKDLMNRIEEALRDLNFKNVAFCIEFEDTEHYTPTGTDRVCYMISTNPGEPLKPLKNVASGGELSRIMLAVKSVLAKKDAIGTQIFDEIDAGISGLTAQKVSEKLHVIAKEMQVICITHLPQIAAMADSHYLIEKGVEEGKTKTRVKTLDEQEQILELARMLGGAKITDAVLGNAKEMKDFAKNAG